MCAHSLLVASSQRLNNFCMCMACICEWIEKPLRCCIKPCATCCFILPDAVMMLCLPSQCMICAAESYWCCLSGCMVAQLVTELDKQSRNPGKCCGEDPVAQTMA